MSRFLWAVVAAVLVLFLIMDAPTSAATPPFQDDYGHLSQNLGPLQLEVAVSPPVARPRDTVVVEMTLTNLVDRAIEPNVEVSLPAALSDANQRYPAGTAFDYQRNILSWQPVLAENEDAEQLSLEYRVSVADLRQPEQSLDLHVTVDGETSTASVNFWVGSPPTASFSVSPQVVAVGQPVVLTAEPGGPGPFTQTWTLSDGREIVAQDPEVTFGTPGNYEIQLKISNPLTVATALGGVTVVAQPTARFALDDEFPVAGQALTFVNESGGERPLSSHWHFGDGDESRESNPTHVYSQPGDYEVRLVVTSDYGQSEYTMPVSVGTNPVADIVIPEQVATGESFEARAFGDDTVTGLTWDMGDGRQVQGDVINHTYYRSGEFIVTLTAANDYGEITVSRPVYVEGGRYFVFLPLSLQGLLDGSPTAEQPASEAPAETEIVQQLGAEPDASDGATTPAQSGSTSPNPGGASAAPIEQPAEAIALPPQPALAPDASTAEQLLWYVNEARRLHGLPPLSYNYELSIAAQTHAEDMAHNPDIMHVGSDGSRPAERQQRYGYRGAYGGEAVAWGWESPVPVVEFWVNSPPHRVLILNPDADEVGVGHMADGRAPNIWYWAVEFGILPDSQ